MEIETKGSNTDTHNVLPGFHAAVEKRTSGKFNGDFKAAYDAELQDRIDALLKSIDEKSELKGSTVKNRIKAANLPRFFDDAKNTEYQNIYKKMELGSLGCRRAMLLFMPLLQEPTEVIWATINILCPK